MFTGIVEALGTITSIDKDGTNIHFTIASDISSELKIDQSIAHNGVCLTVVALPEGAHTVTAIKETIDKAALSAWTVGTQVNLERCMVLGGRLDGHIVQGHVDCAGTCESIKEEDGSWIFTFSYPTEHDGLVISKGSICVNGTSLTVVDPSEGQFSVAIIPYTYEHTVFKHLEVGHAVNLEFDILGKYILKNLNK